MAPDKPILRVLGPMQVEWQGQTLPLLSSRKTRALLAYLALSSQRHARQQLCELLWNLPDDPRASLRWSLSKLRKLFEVTGHQPIRTEGDWVRFDRDECQVDLVSLREQSDPDQLPQAWEAASAPLLIDAEVPNQPDYAAWLERRRRDLRTQRAGWAASLAHAEGIAPEQRDTWTTRWLDDAPFDPAAARMAVEARRATGDAEALKSRIAARFAEAEMDSPFTSTTPEEPQPPASPVQNDTPPPPQDIAFLHTDDGVTIGWAAVGEPDAPPLVKAANWLNHLELDWEAPIWSPLFQEFARSHRFIRYDERGCGLSDWDVASIDFESFVTDLERVVEAAGLDRFPLLGISQGAAVSIEYAARHPDKVSHLVLFGAYDCGWRYTATPEQVREREAVMVLTETGWGSDNPAYRHLFSATFMPDADKQELDWFNEFQLQTTNAANAVRFLEAFSTIDVRDRLAQVQCPTLVVHSRGDLRIPAATGRSIAARIPGARFEAIDSANHLLLGREPASAQFVKLVRDFLKNPG